LILNIDFICRTFPVRTLYLEDLIEQTGYVVEEGSRYARRNDAAKMSTLFQVRSRRGTETHEYVTNVELSDYFSAYSLETRK
jgi:hypothetical protein